MLNKILKQYVQALQDAINKGDAREETFYPHLKDLIDNYAKLKEIGNCDVTILPRATEAGNPDFRIWDGSARITGYIEAKKPETHNLDPIATSEQLKRYLDTFPNLILTNFYEFRLYQHGLFVESVTIASSNNATQMSVAPPITNVDEFAALMDRYFSFSLPAITDPRNLANVLAKRTRFLRDEIIALELQEEAKQGRKVLLNFYESFKKLLINNLTPEQFADLYAQTLTYGIFVARTRSNGEFKRERIYEHIPSTLGILRSIFKFISWEKPPQALTVLIDDISDILFNTDIKKILHQFYTEGKGTDPIVHFYETFLSEYDPQLREKRGVYYTPDPVVRYIVRSIHSLLKTHFGKTDGLASEDVTILDPAAGTLTFPAEAIKLAIDESESKYGTGNTHKLIKEQILPHFYAIELMMAPYTVGHLKISYLLSEHGYEMSEDERFKLYLSNTLEPDTPPQIKLPFAYDISVESEMANKLKHEEPILVIMGNPPYSGASENKNQWTEELLKTDLDGAQSYYTVDGKPLDEKNPKWLQDDYVKFLRFAQWKIHKAGKGIVGMITNHGYIDNPTFKGMRQSLMNTFDEIYVLDLHGNTNKGETCPDGSKDENVFDIRQGTAIILMVKLGSKPETLRSSGSTAVYHHELFGLRQDKYDWLANNQFNIDNYQKISPSSPFNLFRPEDKSNQYYLKWTSLPEIFPVNNVGIVTGRDGLTIQDTGSNVRKTIHHFASLDPETARTVYKLGKNADIEAAQNDLKDSGLSEDNIVPILYRPFDLRYTYYTGTSQGFHVRPRKDVMRHMLEDNLGIVSVRQVKTSDIWQHILISNTISESSYVSNKTSEISYLFPLYLYPFDHGEDIFASEEREYNISKQLLDQLQTDWPNFYPEQLFFYVYAVLHSNIYRERFAQYLSMDFPRIPFTDDYALFSELAELGKELCEIHLLRSPGLSTPVAKYQGKGPNDMVDYIKYDAETCSVHINPDKFFDGITQELWNYYIGGYRVLDKYLKDRKGKTLDDPIHYCRIVTALSLTIGYQARIDEIIEDVLE